MNKPTVTTGVAGDAPQVLGRYYRVEVKEVVFTEEDDCESYRDDEGKYCSRPNGKRRISEQENYAPIYSCHMDELPKFMRI